MGNACSVHGETRNAYRVLGGEREGWRNLKEVGVNKGG